MNRLPAVIFSGLFAFMLGCQSGHIDSERPNVLFVVFDDLNDWEGCLQGHPQSLTPHIDRLAKKGVLFANAHCAGTMCCPSRASVITGLRPTTTGVYKNTDTPRALYKDKMTLNKHFKNNGYYVAGAGKILHRFYFEEGDWDEYLGRNRGSNIIGNREHPDSSKITRVSGNIGWGSFSAPDSLTFDGQTVDWIGDRIDKSGDKPFFLACGIFRPHIPWFAPDTYFEQHPLEEIALPKVLENDLDDVPQSGRDIAHSTSNFTRAEDPQNAGRNFEHDSISNSQLWPEAVQAYHASVSYADAQFGRLLTRLEQSEHAENTIVVLWSDHGYHLGEKNRWRKGTLWEDVTRVPLIFYVPNTTDAGVCQEAVSLLDIYPTLIDLCGLPNVAELEGESLMPQLEDPGTPKISPAISSLTPDFHAIRDDRYRYISYGNGEEELYDHSVDANEWKNIADNLQYVEVKKKLKAYLPQNNRPPVKRNSN